MRSLKSKTARSGLLILTGILTLAFVVSIVYAASDWGVTDNVSWSISVYGVSYNSVTDISSSSHSVYVQNNSDITVFVHYEFKHSIDGNENWTIRDLNGQTTVPPNNYFSHSNTLTRSNGDVPAGNHSVRPYTRVEVRKRLDWPPFISPTPVEEIVWFQK